jgi:2-haloacid dehalogenase
MQRAVVFDINETVLDLAALDPLFTGWFGDAAARREWFAQTLHYAMTLAATRTYRSFSEVGAAALATIAERRGIVLPTDSAAHLRNAMSQLPPHPDVAPALRLLRENDVITVALSNNPRALVEAQLRYAELAPLFDHILSVEDAGALKPAAEVYRYSVGRLELPPTAIWMVAAHGWDIAGATRAGLRGAFVQRPGQLADPFAPPEISDRDMVAVARGILARV